MWGPEVENEDDLRSVICFLVYKTFNQLVVFFTTVYILFSSFSPFGSLPV